MRLWTIHPQFLDVKGLVALWREGLGAQRSLRAWCTNEIGVGYTNHPQLERFKRTGDPEFYLNQYMGEVHGESVDRGYNFNLSRLYTVSVPKDYEDKFPEVPVAEGQVKYEWDHLQAKLRKRDPERYRVNQKFNLGKDVTLEHLIHPMFIVKPGGVESWERV